MVVVLFAELAVRCHDVLFELGVGAAEIVDVVWGRRVRTHAMLTTDVTSQNKTGTR
jgi:hypothetical protein